MKWLGNRMREPSTMAGIGLVGGSLTVYSETGSWLSALIMLLGGVGSVLKGEIGR